MTDVVLLRGPGRIVPRVNWGRWIVDCPVCSSALLVERDAVELGGWVYDDRGRRLRYGSGCWECGATGEVVWPVAEVVDGVERLLALRPDPRTRNWSWPETLNDLLEENLLNGVVVIPAAVAAERRVRTLLAVDDNGIRTDALPRGRRPFRQIGA